MSKTTSLDEALKLVKDGSRVGIGGVSLYRKPMALLRGLVRRNARRLSTVSFFSGMDIELMVAGGCAQKVESCFVSLEVFGLAPSFREAVERGSVEAPPHTEQTILWGLLASALNLPFMPSRSPLGSDILGMHPEYKTFSSPIGGEKLVAIPPIKPDVALMHATTADERGNAQIEGPIGLDLELVKASDKVIVSAERIVEPSKLKESNFKTVIPGFYTDAVVQAPYGAYPTSCYPDYTFDGRHILDYISMLKEGKVSDYLRAYVEVPASLEEYVQQTRSRERISLRS